MKRKWGKGVFMTILVVLSASCCTLGAPVDNQQDEYVQFNREIPANVGEFKVLRTSDKFEMNRYVTKAWELKHADAYEILPHVKKAAEMEKGKVRTLKYKDSQTGNMRYFIQVVAPEFQIPYIEEMIRTLDLPGMESSEGDVKYNYRLLYRNAEDISDIIENTSLSGEGEIYHDKKTNSVWIKDSVSDFKKDLATLKFYDIPIPQVALDLEVIEMENINDKSLGLNWEAWKNAIGGSYNYAISRARESDNTWSDAADPAIYKMRGYDALLTLDATVLADFIDYMIDTGEARIETKTKILVTNGETGVLSSLKKIPYQIYSTDFIRKLKDAADTTKPGASTIDPSSSAGEKSEGIYIKVEPNISLNSTTLDVEVTVNSLSGYTNTGMPIITERKTETNAVIKEGKKFALGVFDKETMTRQEKRVFLLGRIPLLGKIFTRTTDVNRKSKIIVFITPSLKSIEIAKSTILDGNNFNSEEILGANPTDFSDTRIGNIE
jgi:type II secretory pathway component GspD/PulD (secretin)